MIGIFQSNKPNKPNKPKKPEGRNECKNSRYYFHDFLGKPLIGWSIEHALGSKSISEVYVTTDDKEIAEVSRKYGARIIQRPAELATDTSPAEGSLLHALFEIERKRKIDLVVLLQATSPVRDSDDINKAIEIFFSENADSLFSAAILEDFCVWEIIDNEMRSVTFDYKNRGRRQDRGPVSVEFLNAMRVVNPCR